MPHKFRRKTLPRLIHTAWVSSLAVPALGHAQDEINISSESVEFSDSTKCGLEDPKINSPKVLLGNNFR